MVSRTKPSAERMITGSGYRPYLPSRSTEAACAARNGWTSRSNQSRSSASDPAGCALTVTTADMALTGQERGDVHAGAFGVRGLEDGLAGEAESPGHDAGGEGLHAVVQLGDRR